MINVKIETTTLSLLQLNVFVPYVNIGYMLV